ncbi:MAG: hypothetical protein ACOCQD_03305 [archaeon]
MNTPASNTCSSGNPILTRKLPEPPASILHLATYRNSSKHSVSLVFIFKKSSQNYRYLKGLFKMPTYTTRQLINHIKSVMDPSNDEPIGIKHLDSLKRYLKKTGRERLKGLTIMNAFQDEVEYLECNTLDPLPYPLFPGDLSLYRQINKQKLPFHLYEKEDVND